MEEIRALAKFLADNAGQFHSGRAQKDDEAQGAKGENLLLLGDFNMFNRQDVTMEGQTTALTPTGRAGVFDFFEHVYRSADAATYQQQVPASATYNTWRTFQMSDHLPMWCEFQIDDMDAYLTSLEQEFSS